MSIDINHLNIELSRKTIIRPSSFSCNTGELIALCGANGAGKSTILKAISGELPYKGSISMNGLEVSQLKEKSLAMHRAVMPQSVSMVFPFPVHEIIDMGLSFCKSLEQKKNIREEVKTMFHLNDIWHRSYTELSGGQQQRVQLARVIAQILQSEQDKRFLLLDECTSAMDIALMQEVFNVLSELKKKNIGIIAIIHDMNIASLYADRIILLNEQSIYSDGHPNEVITQKSILDVFGANVDLHQSDNSGRPCILFK